MNQSIKISNKHQEKQKEKYEDESEESRLSDEGLKALLHFSPKKLNRPRNAFMEVVPNSLKLRRSIVQRALLHVSTSTPMPDKERGRFFSTDCSLNLSAINSEKKNDHTNEHQQNNDLEKQNTTQAQVITISDTVSESGNGYKIIEADDKPKRKVKKGKRRKNKMNYKMRTRKKSNEKNFVNHFDSESTDSKPHSLSKRSLAEIEKTVTSEQISNKFTGPKSTPKSQTRILTSTENTSPSRIKNQASNLPNDDEVNQNRKTPKIKFTQKSHTEESSNNAKEQPEKLYTFIPFLRSHSQFEGCGNLNASNQTSKSRENFSRQNIVMEESDDEPDQAVVLAAVAVPPLKQTPPKHNFPKPAPRRKKILIQKQIKVKEVDDAANISKRTESEENFGRKSIRKTVADVGTSATNFDNLIDSLKQQSGLVKVLDDAANISNRIESEEHFVNKSVRKTVVDMGTSAPNFENLINSSKQEYETDRVTGASISKRFESGKSFENKSVRKTVTDRGASAINFENLINSTKKQSGNIERNTVHGFRSMNGLNESASTNYETVTGNYSVPDIPNRILQKILSSNNTANLKTIKSDKLNRLILKLSHEKRNKLNSTNCNSDVSVENLDELHEHSNINIPANKIPIHPSISAFQIFSNRETQNREIQTSLNEPANAGQYINSSKIIEKNYKTAAQTVAERHTQTSLGLTPRPVLNENGQISQPNQPCSDEANSEITYSPSTSDNSKILRENDRGIFHSLDVGDMYISNFSTSDDEFFETPNRNTLPWRYSAGVSLKTAPTTSISLNFLRSAQDIENDKVTSRRKDALENFGQLNAAKNISLPSDNKTINCQSNVELNNKSSKIRYYTKKVKSANPISTIVSPPISGLNTSDIDENQPTDHSTDSLINRLASSTNRKSKKLEYVKTGLISKNLQKEYSRSVSTSSSERSGYISDEEHDCVEQSLKNIPARCAIYSPPTVLPQNEEIRPLLHHEDETDNTILGNHISSANNICDDLDNVEVNSLNTTRTHCSQHNSSTASELDVMKATKSAQNIKNSNDKIVGNHVNNETIKKNLEKNPLPASGIRNSRSTAQDNFVVNQPISSKTKTNELVVVVDKIPLSDLRLFDKNSNAIHSGENESNMVEKRCISKSKNTHHTDDFESFSDLATPLENIENNIQENLVSATPENAEVVMQNSESLLKSPSRFRKRDSLSIEDKTSEEPVFKIPKGRVRSSKKKAVASDIEKSSNSKCIQNGNTKKDKPANGVSDQSIHLEDNIVIADPSENGEIEKQNQSRKSQKQLKKQDVSPATNHISEQPIFKQPKTKVPGSKKKSVAKDTDISSTSTKSNTDLRRSTRTRRAPVVRFQLGVLQETNKRDMSSWSKPSILQGKKSRPQNKKNSEVEKSAEKENTMETDTSNTRIVDSMSNGTKNTIPRTTRGKRPGKVNEVENSNKGIHKKFAKGNKGKTGRTPRTQLKEQVILSRRNLADELYPSPKENADDLDNTLTNENNNDNFSHCQTNSAVLQNTDNLQIPQSERFLHKDSGTSTMSRGSTLDDSCMRSINVPGKVTKSYKKKNTVSNTISKVLSRSTARSQELEIVNTVQIEDVLTSTQDPRERRSLHLKVPQEGEHFPLMSNNEVKNFKYIENHPKFRLIEDNILVSDFLGSPNGGTMCYLKLPPGGKKALHFDRKHNLYFFIIEGEGQVQVYNRMSRVSRLAQFIVPKDVEYAIINSSDDQPLLLGCVRI